MSVLKAGFDMALKLKVRDMELYVPDTDTTYNIEIANSNFSRNFQEIEEIVVKGMEFIISKTELDAQSIVKPERNWRIIDTDLGEFTISEVKHMIGLGGEILGYRLRTN